ncbi:high affinity cGMP-specific 3',5'-cyclic phosphodiesterase 9A-like, partial [Rhinophrynus dorsalis]
MAAQKVQKISKEIKEALKKPTFNVWDTQSNQMLTLLEYMFYELDLVQQFKMEPETLRSFLMSVNDHYQKNPFHNFRHGFCVTQMMYSVISLCHLQGRLSPLDIVTLMVASLCHDLDHPGLSNAYQVNAKTDLAVRFKNKSPLENHHCEVTLHLLSRPQSDLFSNAHPEDVTRIKE